MSAQTLRLAGEASLAATVSDGSPSRTLRARYLPELSANLRLSPGLTLDAAGSVHAWAARAGGDSAGPASAEGVDEHRAWLRLSGSRVELRAGLQSLSFGSASVLRPLLWFDRVDPRDPLQLTEGVWAGLLRAYLPGNATLWGWAVRGEAERRGWEVIGGLQDGLEAGGRIQLQAGSGELGASYHRRSLDLGGLGVFPPGAQIPAAREDRIGIDGKWDVGPGLWFEAEFTRQRSESLQRRWLRAFAVGGDYTLGIGEGLTLLAEHMVKESPVLSPGQLPPPSGPAGAAGALPDLRLTAVTASYAPGVLDRVALAVYHDWEGDGWFRLLELRRTYDHVRLHLVGFWSPAAGGLFPGVGSAAGAGSFAGKGVELILVINH